MIKIISIIFAGILSCTTITAGNAWAHGAHGAHFEKSDAIDLASRYLVTIVKKKTPIEGKALDSSWLNIPSSDKAVTNEEEWYFIVSMHNSGKKKTLFMLISKKGKLYQVNFSGKFPQVE